MLFIVFILALISLTYWLLNKKHSYWKNRGVPQLQPKFFFGDFKGAILKKLSLHDVIQDAYNKFKAAGYKHGKF